MDLVVGLLIGWAKVHYGTVIVGTGIGALLGVLLKKYFPQDKLSEKLDKWLLEHGKYIRVPVRKIFRVITLNITNWPVIGLVWNKVFEPYVIFFGDLIFKIVIWAANNAVIAAKEGLLSDNPSFAGQLKSEKKKSVRESL